MLRLASTQLALTNQRLLGKTGTFRHKKIDLLHKDIEVVVTSRGLLGLVFGYGTVTITGKGGIKAIFYGIKKPKIFCLEVEKASEIAVLGRILPREDSPVVIPKKPIQSIEIKSESSNPYSPHKDPSLW